MHHHVEFSQSFDDEAGYFLVFDLMQQFCGRGHDIFRRFARYRVARLAHDEAKVLKIIVIQFERNP